MLFHLNTLLCQDFHMYMARAHVSAQGTVPSFGFGSCALVALILLASASYIVPLVGVVRAQSVVAACEYSPNGNAYAFADQAYENGAWFTYHDSRIGHYVNSNGFAKAIDEGGGMVWFDQFTQITLEYAEGPNAYGFSQTVDTYTNDGTQSGYNGPGFVWVQVYNGVAYPQCPYNTPVRQ
jgi:hypothetical protein